jgi:cyanate lyase
MISLEPNKDETVKKLLAAKKASGKTWDEIADAMGLCNCYVGQLFRRQAQLKDNSVAAVKAAVPGLTDDLIEEMKRPAFRYYDERVIQEPHIYRMTEVCTHYGDTILDIIHEQLGDGIMSAIDFKLTVGKTVGDKGEDRVVITWNGKFLPHIEQKQ